MRIKKAIAITAAAALLATGTGSMTAATACADTAADTEQVRNQAAAGSAVSVSDETGLKAAFANASTDSDQPTVISLSGDIRITGALTQPQGTYMTINGNGYTIRLAKENAASELQKVFLSTAMLTANGSLTLNQVSLDAYNGSMLLSVSRQGSVVINDGTELKNGYRGENGTLMASGISVSGQLTMNGGTISGCVNKHKLSSDSDGGTVRVENTDAVFTMNGGTIENNKVESNGGGVYVNGGTFTMKSGAVIQKNQASYQISQSASATYSFGNGGGVYVNSGTFVQDGGEIRENTAEYSMEARDSDFYAPDVETSGNGGGVFVKTGSYTLNNGTVTRNQARETDTETLDTSKSGAQGLAGGIFVNSGVRFSVAGGEVSGNSAAVSDANGIYLAETNAMGKNSEPDILPMELSGSPKLTDEVYLTSKAGIRIVGSLGANASVKAVPYAKDAGTVLAAYASESLINASQDPGCFQVPGASGKPEVKGTEIVIGKTDLSECAFTLNQKSYIYTGGLIEPDVTVYDPYGKAVRGVKIDVYQDGEKVTKRTKAGTADFTITGNDNTTTGELTGEGRSFTVTPLTLTEDNVRLKGDSCAYTGEAVTPEIQVETSDAELSEEDYRISYGDAHTAPGRHTLTVSGTGGNTTGSVTLNYYIRMDQKITVPAADLTKTYGDADFNVSAQGTPSGGALRYTSSDPSVASVDEKGNVHLLKAGNVTIKITAAETDQYEQAVKNVHLKVNKRAQSFSGSYSYKKTTASRSFSLNTKLKAGNGKLTYTSGSAKVVAVDKKGKVTVKGPGRANITVKAAETSQYKAASYIVTVTVSPKKVTALSITNRTGRKAAVKWKKQSAVTGYQICYSVSKNFKKNTRYLLVKNNKASRTVTGLKKGTTYYVRVRAYKTVNGKALIGSYSTVKKIKIKK
jgi:hypothetical protein